MEIYKINPELLNKFMFRKALGAVGLMAGIVLGFMVVMGLMSEMKIIFFLLKAFWGWILLFLIVIKALDYNFMNGNGRIEIPSETEDFEVIKKRLKEICKSYRSIQRLF